MKIKLDKKSEALLKEMLRKNSHYGSVDLILNEAVGLFYASERKKDFVSTCRLPLLKVDFLRSVLIRQSNISKPEMC